MNNTRTAHLPFDHLDAELAAFPLASETALELGVYELDPLMKGPTKELWRSAEASLLSAWPSLGLDEFVSLRDKSWFDGATPPVRSPSTVPLATYLKRVAQRALAPRGTVARPKEVSAPGTVDSPEESVRSRGAWRWMTFALPEDLLLAALCPEAPPHRVETLDPRLARALADRGYAETHLHVMAALSFPQLWTATLFAVMARDTPYDAFAGPGSCLQEGKMLGPWLLRAAVTRHLLAVYLGSARGSQQGFRDFLREHSQRVLGGSGGATCRHTLLFMIRALMRGQGSSDSRQFEAEKAVARRLLKVRSRLTDDPEDLWRLDPIASRVPCSGQRGASPEQGLIALALDYLEERARPSNPDRELELLFWQMVRVRCLFYRHVTQRPLTPGLQWFIRTYSRMKAGRRLLPAKFFLRAAAELGGGARRGLRSLEIRTSPESRLSDQVELLRSISEEQQGVEGRMPGWSSPLLKRLRSRRSSPHDAQAPRPLELGAVFHFSKLRGGGWERGAPSASGWGSHADPRFHAKHWRLGNPAGYRFSRYYREQLRRAHALVRCLVAFPASLQALRGVDVCTDERGVPTWVLAPLMRYVKEAGETASQVLRRNFAVEVPPLGATIHCGEDFVHLLSGLRSIDESIRYFHLAQGDRLGHGLALGIDPKAWCKRTRKVMMAREERMWDLVWEWRRYSQNSGLVSPRRDALLWEIAFHSEAIFDREISPRSLARMMDALHEESVLRSLGFPDGPVPPQPAAHEQDQDAGRLLRRNLVRYLTDGTCFQKGQEVIEVETAGEAATLEILQDELRRKVGALGLVIEVNPSSNLLIADLGGLADHPLWRLHSPRRSDEGPGPLPICIGSDDPLTFATDLPSEYQWVKDAMILSGYSEAEAARWMEEARKTGLTSRFTLTAQPLRFEPCPSQIARRVRLPP